MVDHCLCYTAIVINLELTERARRYPWAQHAGNESRYVNDHRGVATVKNVQLVEIRSRAGELQVWMEALRTIHSGEEILTHYGSRYSVEEA